MSESSAPLPPEALAYYARGREARRLGEGHGPLEFARTCDILQRWLPDPPGRVLDVGGGPGPYAVWLARRGYRVALIDAVPLHVTRARDAASSAGQTIDARLGDARRLEEVDGSADAVLLLGPLYHLTERSARLQALREARRVLRPSGLVFAVGVSRFASLLSGLFDGFLADPAFRGIVERDLRDGQHRNPTSQDYFTTAFFHHPDELRAEVTEAGFAVEGILGVEGPGWALPDLAVRWADPARRRDPRRGPRGGERTLAPRLARPYSGGGPRRARAPLMPCQRGTSRLPCSWVRGTVPRPEREQ